MNAPVRIVEYSNFTCSVCQGVLPAIEQILAQYPGKIRYEFRHFPPADDRRAVMAHLAAESAAQQGHFWAYHDRLFQQRAAWISSPDLLEAFVRFALDLGLDGDRFTKDFFDSKTLERVEADLTLGRQLGVRVTPTFFVQDHVLVGPLQFKEEAEKWIQEAFKK